MTKKKDGAAVAQPKGEPGPRNKRAIAKAINEHNARPTRVALKWEARSDSAIAPASPHADDAGHMLQLINAFGTTSSSFMGQGLSELEMATRDRHQERGQSSTGVNAGLALLGAIAPQDEVEAALGLQMAGCHTLAMEMLGRAKTTDRSEHVQLYGNMAVKLQRTFTAQIEALARLRGKGQQTVRVEHVTVHPGGQAIVGDVHHHPRGVPGGQSHSEERPHETTQPASFAPERTALPCPDSLGNGVPVPGHAERPVPTPRRTVARRPRKSERLQARELEPRDDRDAARPAGDAATDSHDGALTDV